MTIYHSAALFLRVTGVFCGLVFALLLGGCGSTPPESTGAAGGATARLTQFALIGDNPYQDYNFPKYERLIRDINATPDVSWVIHLGDTKDGGTPCTDEALGAIKAMNDQFNMPFMLTPGDNDWFDCARTSAGDYDRRERLAKFREVFFGEPTQLPGTTVVSQQSTAAFPDYVENVYWIKDNVIYALVHMIGVNGTEGGMDIHDELMTAGVAWIDEVFAVARRQNMAAVFIGIQANPYPFTGEYGWRKSLCPDGCPDVRSGYEKLQTVLLKETETWTRPVMLATGDTHTFRVDKPLYREGHLVEQFSRVESFGEDQVHWVRIVVDPDSPQVFSVHQHLIPANLGTGWREEDLHLRKKP